MHQFMWWAVLLWLSAPLSAQARRTPKLAMPTGVTGWVVRLDPAALRNGAQPTDVELTALGEGMQLTARAPGVYFAASNVGSGTYRVSAILTQRRGAQPVYHGLFMGGTQLDGAGLNYLYCAVAANGTFLVSHRVGDHVNELASRTAHPAVKKASAEGRVTNLVSWRVTPKRTTCLVNGTEVWGYASSALLGPGKLEALSGVAGIRADRGADLEISGFRIEPG